MKRRLAFLLACVLVLGVFSALFAACAKEDAKKEEGQNQNKAEFVYEGLTSTGDEENKFAVQYSMEKFTDSQNREYTEIQVFKQDKSLDSVWLLLPQGVDSVKVTSAEGNVSGGAEKTVNFMTWQDRQNIMVSSASTMSLINALGALDRVPMTTADTTWRIQEIKDAIEDGTITEVGKYSAPDYELILSIGEQKKVSFVVFSTMLDSVPDVEEQLTQTCGLRVMRDQSNYEGHPLGRTEWIKVYGEIFDMREEADSVFAAQVDILNDTLEKIGDIKDEEKKTVLIFYTTSSKETFYVRNAADYVTELVNLAGGKQVTLIGEGQSGNTKMSQEAFIATCSGADYVLYNWTSGASGVSDQTMQGLLDARLGDWFKQFKAYQDGNVWRTSDDFYQKTDKMGEMVADIYRMLYDPETPDTLTYVNRLSEGDREVDETPKENGAILFAVVGGIAVLLAAAVVVVVMVYKKKKTN